jgi:uncharacterized protein YifE (UPF0438 family)
MSEEDLQLLVTLDDPWDAQEDDNFNHLQAENIVAWPGEPFPETGRHDHQAEAVIDNGPYPVVFSQGDWTCTLARLTGTTNDSMRGLDGNMIQPTNQKFEIEVCIVTCSKKGEIVEQKVFYDLVGMQKQFGVR